MGFETVKKRKETKRDDNTQNRPLEKDLDVWSNQVAGLQSSSDSIKIILSAEKLHAN